MPDFTTCIENAKKSLLEMSADDIDNYVKKTLENAKKTGLSGKAAIQAAKEKTYDETLSQLGSNAHRSINSVNKYEKIAHDIKSNKLTIRDFISRGTKNLSNNIESAQLSSVNNLMNAFSSTLTKKELSFMQDVSNEEEIGKAVDGHIMSKEANKVAKGLINFMTQRSSKMVLSDAMALEDIQSDRWLRAIHNPSKMINPTNALNRISQYYKAPYKFLTRKTNFNPEAKANWVQFIKNRLDLDETFKNTDAFDGENIDHVKTETILNEIYDNIVEGKSNIFQKTGILRDIESLKKRRRMFFHWKDFNSFLDYNQEYGAGNLFGALMSDLHSSANKIGISEVLGAAPEQVYEIAKRDQIREGIKKGNTWYHNTDLIYKWVSGSSKVSVSPKMATFFSNLRAYGSMARLGGIVGQSLTDVNVAASYASRFGISYADAFARQLNALQGQFTSFEMKNFSEMMHLEMRHHMGYIGRFVDAQDLGNITSKVSNRYFKTIGMQAWDNGNRLGIMTTISRQFSKNKEISFKNLDPKLQQQLENFNISDMEWNKMRSNIENNHLTLDVVNKLSNDDLKQIRSKLNQDSFTLSDIRSQLYRKLHTLYDVSADNAILTPGAYEQAMLLRGTRPGTIEGEFYRTIMQFKGFAFTFINRSLANGWKNAEDGPTKKALFAVQLFGLMMPIAYMSTYFFNLSKGLSTPEPSKMTTEDVANLMAAPFGVLASVLNKSSQNSSLIGDIIGGGPLSRFSSSLISAAGSLAEGDLKKSKKNIIKALQYTLPGSTIPFIQPYLKKAMGEKEYKNPNQHILFGE